MRLEDQKVCAGDMPMMSRCQRVTGHDWLHKPPPWQTTPEKAFYQLGRGGDARMMVILQEAQPPGTKDDELKMLRTAEELETDNPLWIVVFGVYSRQFVAFPRFSVPVGTMATAHYPGALVDRMRRMELAAGAVTEIEKHDLAERETG